MSVRLWSPSASHCPAVISFTSRLFTSITYQLPVLVTLPGAIPQYCSDIRGELMIFSLVPDSQLLCHHVCTNLVSVPATIMQWIA